MEDNLVSSQSHGIKRTTGPLPIQTNIQEGYLQKKIEKNYEI